MRLAFLGTPDFACPALARLIAGGHEVVCVYTQPPRPAQRGQKAHRSPVHELAGRHGIEVRTPANLKDPETQAAFAALETDAAIVVAYGLILPPAVLAAPRLGCLNIHASLLPRWRGAAPIQRAILAGDTQTGVTIMVVDEGLDTGPELLKKTVPITGTTMAGELHDRLAEMGAEAIIEALEGLAAGRLHPTPQAKDGATYAKKLERHEGLLDWRRPAEDLARRVRALNPWPGTWFDHDGQRIKVRAATPVAGSGAPGTILAPPLIVACGAGALSLERLQRPGKAPLDAADFMHGFALAPGAVLSGKDLQ